MRAAVLYEPGGPEVLRYDEVADPVPGPGEVLVEVRAVGIQGGDVLARASGVPRSVPHIVGYQVAGNVAGLGDGVRGLEIGQRVAAFMSHGSHAELACAAATTVWPIPERLSWEHAATIPVEFGTAHDALFAFGGLRAGETVLVQGAAGGVGIAAVQLAKAAGATVIATASSAERLSRVAEYGADFGLEYRDDVAAAVAELTAGRGADLVVDPIGGASLTVSIEAAAYRGRVQFVGVVARDPTPPQIGPLLTKSAGLQGLLFGREMRRDPHRTSAVVDGLLRRAADGDLSPAIDSTFPLREAAKAHRYIESRQAFGRVLLIP